MTAKVPHGNSYIPTEEHRKMVMTMIGVTGLTLAESARILGICDDTLRKHYSEEIATAKSRATNKVAAALFKTASNPDAPQHVQAARFFLACRARWSTTDVLEIRATGISAPVLADLRQLPLENLRALEAIAQVIDAQTREDDEEKRSRRSVPARIEGRASVDPARN